MAEAAHITPKVCRHPAMDAHDLALAAAAKNWEGPLGDLHDMSGLASDYIEDLFVRSKKDGVFYIDEQHVSRALFALYRVHSMVCEFRELYYAALEVG